MENPLGNGNESMSWLVSFLSIWPRILSPNDNFLLFGANCKEDIKVIEGKTYTILGKEVTFKFEVVPSDMKFLAFFNVELNNAAQFFFSVLPQFPKEM